MTNPPKRNKNNSKNNYSSSREVVSTRFISKKSIFVWIQEYVSLIARKSFQGNKKKKKITEPPSGPRWRCDNQGRRAGGVNPQIKQTFDLWR